jgi:hypothetical protein
LAAHLKKLHGTLVRRGTPVEKHWSTSRLKGHKYGGQIPTERLMDLGKLYLRWFGFRPEPISTNTTAASKNDTQFKSGQI